MAIRRPSKWISLFQQFVKDARIASKELISNDERGSPLVMWSSQKTFLQNVAEGLDEGVRTFVCLKSRQLGVTTISLLIDVFWLAMHSNLTMALVVDIEKNREENRATLRRYVNSFPDGYFGNEFKIDKDNRSVMSFTNGSRIVFLVAGTNAKSIAWSEGVGYAAAHITEAAKYGNPEALASFEESFAQHNPNRLYIYESTAHGFNHWHEKWTKAKADPSTYRAFFIGWWSGDGNRILRSDPRYQQYTGAASGEERELVAAVAHLYGHRIDDEQLAWIRWKQENAGSDADLLEQNQPWTERMAFVQSGYSFFQVREISKDMKRLIDNEDDRAMCRPYRYHVENSFFDLRLEPITEFDDNTWKITDLRVYQEPVVGAKYVIGFDVAYGRNDHQDKNAILVFRCFADRLQQVAEYATPDHDPRQATWVLCHLAGAYQDCVINHEVNGPGGMVITEMEHVRGLLNAEMNEAMVRSKDWENALGQARWYLFHRPDAMGAGYAIGFSTTFNNKSVLLFGYRSAYTSKELDIRSYGLLQEMSVVVQNGAEIGAPESSSSSSKDDRVFAAALAHKAWADWVRPGMIANGLTFERVMAEERGESTLQSRSLNGIVTRFFQTAEEKARALPEHPPWREARGLA